MYIPVRTEQQEYTAMCLFKDIYDKSLAVEVAVSGVQNKFDCEFQGTYILDNYRNPTSNEEPNASPLDPKEPDSHIDEVIIKHEGKLASSPIPIYIITNVFNQIKFISPFDQDGYAYNTYYIVDDGTCKMCVFNIYFETKGLASSQQEIGLLPDSVLPTDGKSMGFPASVYRNAGGYINWLGITSKLKKLVQVVIKGVSWMNDKVVKPIMPITNALLQSLGSAGSLVAKALVKDHQPQMLYLDRIYNKENNNSDKILRHSDRMITQGKRFRLIQLVNVYSFLEMSFSESLFKLTNIQSDYFCAIKHESLAYEDAYPQITGELVDY
ncbi:MAG: hypothetical protein EZS28_045154 [Streblomastix strix]|uniref:Uncharacterized protein n=1 Tax=Streblomastix strix TaxID=222440 RepID=A0A5J4TMV8_9EUKA|nr:MAG: hypothetical protein EZS28_045154 [Streblomastix strix]